MATLFGVGGSSTPSRSFWPRGIARRVGHFGLESAREVTLGGIDSFLLGSAWPMGYSTPP